MAVKLDEAKFTNPMSDDEQMASVDVSQAARDQEIKEAAFGTMEVDDSDEAMDSRFREKWFGILHPDMPARGAYDLVQLCIMMYLGYLLPLRQAFTQTASGPLEVTLDLIIDLSVWIDMFMQMRMCYYDRKTKKLVTDQRQIKREYVRSWLFVDFFSVVPADQVLLLVGTIMVDNTSSERGVEWGVLLMEWSVTARLMRLLRLVRLAKIKQLLNLEKVTHTVYTLAKKIGVDDITKLQVSFYFRVIFLIGLILSAGHFLGCVWLMIGRHNVLQLQNPQGWMVNAYEQATVNMTKDYIACIGGGFSDAGWNDKHGASCPHKYSCVPIPPENPYDVDCSWIESRMQVLGGTGFADGVGASEGEQYLSAFYFALVTLTTVGYGDILPDTKGEKQFVMCCIILGAFLYAYIIGDFSHLLTNLSQERDDFDKKMRTINGLLSFIDAPPDVRHKVQNYYDFKFENKEGSTGLMDEMPASLQVALVKHRYGDLISRVPFFASLHDKALVDLCQKMKSFTATPGDTIMERGSWHDELLILSKGVAKTATPGEDGRYGAYEVGSFWGEMQFLGLEKQRTISVVAESYCEIASLSPLNIAVGSTIHSRLSAYAKLQAEVTAKLASGQSVDLATLDKELEERFASEIDGEVSDEEEPPPLLLSGAAAAEGGGGGGGGGGGEVVAALGEMQRAQRQTDTQLDLISKQLKEMAAANSSTTAQLKELTSAVTKLQRE